MSIKTGPWGETYEVPDAPVESAQEPTPVVETAPVQDTPPTDPTPAAAEPQPTVVEKIVEVVKEVEKPITFANDTSKLIYEHLTAGNESTVAEYLAEKNRNYDTMSDLDAVKWQLRKENPDWKDKDIDAEIRYKYGKSLEKIDITTIDPEDIEALQRAERHNEAVEDKILLLERDSRDARIKLNKQKQNIELPKLQTPAPVAQEPDQPTPEQIEAQKREWEGYVEAEMPNLSDFKFTVDGEEVNYKMTDDDKKLLTAEMKGFNAVEKLTELGWRDKEGKLNPAKIAKDMHLIRNAEKLIKSAYSQGKTAGKKEVVTADIKNISLNPRGEGVEAQQVDIWDQIGSRRN